MLRRINFDGLRVAKILSLCSLAVLFGSLAYQVLCLPYELSAAITSRVDTWAQVVGTAAARRDEQLASVLELLHGYLNMDELQANVMTTSVILKDVADITSKAKNELLPDVDNLLKSGNGLVQSMQKDLDKVSDTAVDSLKPLKDVLQNTATLMATLDKEVKEGSPEMNRTAAALAKSLEDLDKIISDPAIEETLGNVQRGTDSLAESAKSVDMALRPWRERAALLKTIVSKALSIIKITVPLPGL